jgi:4-amino-4-deoxy-L-arabinose transferase-like glycosyltransferase
MTDRRFWWMLAAILLLALALRGVFPAADPPWRSTVGVVWHDEGAWTHNARNKVLYGAWVQDQWNPVYIAPVFTGLEYLSFEAFGVGLRQARLVSQAAGLISVLLLALGIRRIAGHAAGLYAGALLATNYVYVMYDRAALMEALMTALIVASWYCVARAERQPRWGAAAGLFAVLAFFTKAAAVAYVGALGLVALLDLLPVDRLPKGRSYLRNASSLWVLAGLAVSFGAIGACFVLPHWRDYQFYNWEMSVTRKPSYSPFWLMTRVTWFPILHDTFSRMWGALCLGLVGAWATLLRWRRAGTGERLLLLWLAVGILELLVHDVSNERRFVFLIPALVALASLVLARGTLLGEDARSLPRAWVVLAAPVIFYCAYVIVGALVRVYYLDEVYAGVLKKPVRVSAAAAVLLTAVILAAWPRVVQLLAWRWVPRIAAGATILAVLWNTGQFADWAARRTYKNYQASIDVGRALPAGTLVQGKLANGLALENRIRPIFIGHGFGNYTDRKARWDVRYILTYTDPEIGHEGDQIVDVLAAYPGWRIIMTFPVAETASGHDQAALIEKRARD